jgi:hypothetical protein
MYPNCVELALFNVHSLRPVGAAQTGSGVVKAGLKI